MGGIVYLASYPKSGNTWFRAFISNLLNEKDEAVSINRLQTDGIFSSRHILDSVIGVESANLTPDEIDRLRPTVYNHLARTAVRPLFVKVHDAYTYLANGEPLLGTVKAKAVYIVRNPLDVAVSFASHIARDLDFTVGCMADERYAFGRSNKSLPEQLRQRLLTWGRHAESWMQARELAVHLIRYEDMMQNPVASFTEAVRFIGLDCTDAQIEKAICLSDFAKLKAEEAQQGFKERPYQAAAFFRSGRVGDWRNHLSDAQVEQLLRDHGETMRKLGYADEQGNPVY